MLVKTHFIIHVFGVLSLFTVTLLSPVLITSLSDPFQSNIDEYKKKGNQTKMAIRFSFAKCADCSNLDPL